MLALEYIILATEEAQVPLVRSAVTLQDETLRLFEEPIFGQRPNLEVLLHRPVLITTTRGI